MVAIIPAVETAKITEETPRRYGLFDAAIGPVTFPDIHMRGGGLFWLEAMCGGGQGYEINCIDALDPKDFATGGINAVTGVPFVVMSNFQCLFTDLAEAERLARQKFFSIEQSQVEAIFSTSGFGQSPGLSGNPDIVDLSAEAPATQVVGSISVLEDWIYCTQQYGPRAVLHMPTAVFNHLKSEHLIEFDGRRWRTPHGTVISAGCYAGADPDGVQPAQGTYWVYVTGQTVVYTTDPGDIEQIPVQGALNRTTNEYTALVEREYVVAFECGVAGKPVTLWTP